MSETPGQVLERVFLRVTADKAIPVDDCFAEIAAAFLAEVDTVTLLKAAKDRVGHAPGEWGDE